MSAGDEELTQRNLVGKNAQVPRIGPYLHYSIGATTIEALRRHGVIPAGNYTEIATRKPDGLLIEPKSKTKPKRAVVAVIENKPTGSKQDSGRQACSVGYALGAKICLTQTGSARAHVVVPRNAEGDWTPLLDDRGQPMTVDMTDHTEVVALLRDVDQRLVGDRLVSAVAVDPAPLAKRIWQLTWQLTKQSPQRSLATFVEVFLYKYLSDLSVIDITDQGHRIGFGYVYKTVGGKNKETCLKYYQSTVRPYIKDTLFPVSHGKTDGTTILNGFVFDQNNPDHCRAFYEILAALEDFGPLRKIAPEFKSRLFEDFLKNSQSTKDMGQYFTPRIVMKAVIDMADVRNKLKDGAIVNDPACGVGGFLLETMAARGSDFIFDGQSLRDRIHYRGFDMAQGQDQNDNLTIILAKANFIIYLADLLQAYPNATQEFARQFNQVFWSYNKTALGSLSEVDESAYDLTLSNPPYVSSGSSLIKKLIQENGLASSYSHNGTGTEGLFFEKIIRELKPGGEAYVIVPDGIAKRPSDQALRDWALEECFLDAVISLPESTFYTTIKKTYILALRKKPEPSPGQNHPVLHVLTTDIGETLDTYRLPTTTSNLVGAVEDFKVYKALYLDRYGQGDDQPQTSSFLTKSSDASRVRLAPAIPGTSWVSEQHFTHDELVSLGVKCEVAVADPLSVMDQLRGLSAKIEDLQVELAQHLTKVEQGYTYQAFRLGEIIDFERKARSKQKMTKKDLHGGAMAGLVPVYSAATDPAVVHGRIQDNLDGVVYSENCLQITTNGAKAGTLIYRDHRFATTGDAVPLQLKEGLSTHFDYDYLRVVIGQSLLDKGYGWDKKLKKGDIQAIEVDVPVDFQGMPDLIAQQQLVGAIMKIDEAKAEINGLVETLGATHFSPVRPTEPPTETAAARRLKGP